MFAALQSQLSSAKKMREQVLAEEQETAKEPASPTRRLDPMLEKEARQLDTAIERTEAQLKAKDVEAKNLNGRSPTPKRAFARSNLALNRRR